jgi:hypothetical protein
MEQAKHTAERFNREAETLSRDIELQQRMTPEQRLYVEVEVSEASSAAEILSEGRTTAKVRELGEHLHDFVQGEIDTLVAHTPLSDNPRLSETRLSRGLLHMGVATAPLCNAIGGSQNGSQNSRTSALAAGRCKPRQCVLGFVICSEIGDPTDENARRFSRRNNF